VIDERMIVMHWRDGTDKKQPNYLYTGNSMWIRPAIIPDFRTERPKTNHLCQGISLEQTSIKCWVFWCNCVKTIQYYFRNISLTSDYITI